MDRVLAFADEAPPPRVRRMDGVMAGFCLGVLALCAGVGGGTYWFLTRPQPSAPPTMAIYSIAGQAIGISSAWLRPDAPSPLKPVERLDLTIDARVLAGLPAEPSTPPVSVTMRAGDSSLSPAERPSLLYARFLSSEATRLSSGLIRRSFKAGTPYGGEALYVAPPDGRGFAARCVEEPGAVRQSCLAEFRIGGLDVQARFAPELLEHWSSFERGLRRIVEPKVR